MAQRHGPTDCKNGPAWQVQLAGGTPVPKTWFGGDGDVTNKDILCLASAGGQQAPVLAAAGANVNSLDLSDSTLATDRGLGSEHGLKISCQQGSMTDLSCFEGASFDLVFLAVATCYVADVHVIWKQCARVLRPHGRMLVGAINPLLNLFEENAAAIKREMAFVWSHTLSDLVGGQLSAGFHLLEFAEARRTDLRAPTINKYTNTYFMTAAEIVRS